VPRPGPGEQETPLRGASRGRQVQGGGDGMQSKQRDRGPPAGAVHGHGKADGLPDGFRFAKRAAGPPFGSTGNAPAGRPSGPQPFHTRGLSPGKRCAFPTPPLSKKSAAVTFAIKIDIGNGAASLAALVTPLDGTGAGPRSARPSWCPRNPSATKRSTSSWPRTTPKSCLDEALRAEDSSSHPGLIFLV
jgi:hypothetical protein